MQKLFFIGLLVGLSVCSFAQKQIKQYEYWFDNNYQAKKAANITPSTSFTLNTSVSTTGLPEGLHTFRIRFMDISGVWSTTTNQFFNKALTISNNGIVKYEYWFDHDYAGKKGEAITANDSISLVSTISTGNLHEGLHTFQIRFQDKTGAWSVPSIQFFTKQSTRLAIGENKIVAYRYWLDKDFTNQKTVKVDPINPLILSSVSIPNPAKATPNNYEFFPDPISGHKITYHSQFCLNIQFKDKINQWSVVSNDSVLHPYSVNVQYETLSSGVPKVKNYPKADTIHFFMAKAKVGDSLVFKSNKSVVIDLFDPSGKKISTISRKESTLYNGFHAQLDGEYYALIHGFSPPDSGSYTFNYLHFPKYCVLSYSRKIVGNNGTDTIVFKGNGFTKYTKFTLISSGSTIGNQSTLCNYLTVCKPDFKFINIPVGQYDIHVNYGDTTIVIEKGLEVVNSLTHNILFGEVSMPTKGNYPFAGVYEYENLIIDEGTTLLSYGISQLVIKVKGTLLIGKNVSIRVRNGYYADADAPFNSISNITKDNINNISSSKGDGYSLYPNTFGKGGDGGDGANGGMGKNYLIYLGFNQYTTIYGNGGSGGGGGGGGFGGGNGGDRGILGVGTGGNGAYGGNGEDNGGPGGFGGNNPSASTGGGGSVGVGAVQDQSTTGFGAGGPGGGGNGGVGAIFGSASGGNGFGGPGGGGGGYGGGILVIAANEIFYDPISKPLFLALGQTGGKGGIGLLSVTNGGDGKKGGDGLVIINTPNKIPEFVFKTNAYGSNYSPLIGGHGLVSGEANVLYNVDVFVCPLPASAGAISGIATVCEGQNAIVYTVPAIANATSYVWTLPSVATGTSTTNSITVNYGTSAVSGNITVKGKNECGEGTASTLAIVVNPLPANAGVITGTATVCQGQNAIVYTVPAIANATSYVWTLPSGATGTSTTNSITINYGISATSGNITVKGKNDCGDGTASTLAIVVNPLPSNAEIITGLATVCQGQNAIVYTVPTIANATSYIWTLPTGAAGTSTTNSITVNYGTSAVSGNITVKGKNECGNGAATTLAIVVNPLPAAPVITINGTTLHSDAIIGNQWYNQIGAINEAKNQDFLAASTNDYTAVVSLLGCSSAPSNTINFVITGIDASEQNQSIKVYPNPVSNELYLENNGNIDEIKFVIVNSRGQIVYKSSFYEKAIVSMGSFARGMYLIKFDLGKTSEIRKVIKN